MTGRAKAILAAMVLTGAFAAGWVAQDWRAEAAAARVEVKQSKTEVAQSQKAQAATENKAVALLGHAAAQQENTHDYTQKLLALEAGRTADAVRIAGLQRDISAAATRHAQAAGDAAACRDLANRHTKLATLAGEGGAVVAGLAGLVKQRDAEVGLLLGQAAVDGRLLARD